MKCALELVTVATMIAEQKAKEEAERKARLEAEKRERTLAFCEKIGEKLEEKANQGNKPCYYFDCTNRYEPMRSTRKEYADGRESHIVTDGNMSLKLMKEWFKPYCFIVKVEEMQYWHYGCGHKNGYSISIVPDPDCLK
jgi:hypothetical protein